MRIAIYASDKPRDLELAEAVLSCFGGEGEIFRKGHAQTGKGFTLHSITGLKHASIMRKLREAGEPYLYWDKGLFRDQWPQWWRVSYCAQQPGDFIGRLKFSHDRAGKQGWFRKRQPWRMRGNHVLLCGWSGKCSAFLGIPDPTTTIRGWIGELSGLTSRPLVYRSKPSWPGAERLAGAGYSPAGRRTIEADLQNAHALVTFSSGTCFDALLAGIPSILLGPGLCRPVSSTALREIEDPYLATDAEVVQLLANAAYLHWSLPELRSGAARGPLEEMMERA